MRNSVVRGLWLVVREITEATGFTGQELARAAARACPVFLLFCNLFPTTYNLARAQTTSASVSGTIVDHQGGLVPSVQVVILNTDTNERYQTKTNGAGVYSFPNLKPGHYHIVVTKEGFKQIDLREITLNVQDSLDRNFTLDVGGVSETVVVNAGDRININTTDATVGTVIDQTYVKNMPLNGRSFQDLILLTPGTVTQTPQANLDLTVGGGKTGEFSVNGQRTESNNYAVDGVSANVGAATGQGYYSLAGPSGSVPGSTALGTTQALVSVDALQEFRVQTSTYSAEYGRNPGGQFSFETKSGTNLWHGSAYDYLRNGYFDAQDWFNNYFGHPEPALHQNDFGGTLGGPVKAPSLYDGQDKTFFFVSYEGLRLTAPQAASSNFVPDAALRASAPPALTQVMNAFPLPSPGGIDDAANGFAQFIGSWSNPSSLDATSVRFDHVVNEKMRLFFRFGNTESSSTSRDTYAQFATPSMTITSASTLRTYTAGVSGIFSNRLSNEFRLNYSSNRVTSSFANDAFGGSTPVNLAQAAGLPASSEPAIFFIYGGYGFGLFTSKESGAQRQWNFLDDVSMSIGRHQLKFGADYRRLTPFSISATPTVSYLYFSKSSVTGNSAFIALDALAAAYPLYQNFSAFAQDEWRVWRRLNLSFGLRWEVNPAPGVTQGLKPYTIQGSGPSNWTLAPQGTPLWQTTWYNFAPRLGAAYVLRDAVGWETVVRGGGGVFFDTGQQQGSRGFGGPGFSAFGSAAGPFPSPVAIPVIANPPAPNSSAPVGFSRHLQLPYTLQWSASVEQALGKAQAVTISYVGAHAARLLQANQFSAPISPFGVFLVENGLTSDYDALQTQFRRRINHGLTTLASYTWSHCIDYGSQNYHFEYQRGNCDFDIRHNLSAAFSYDLPNVGHNGFLNAVLHHWGLDDRFTARTSFPVTLNGNTIVDPSTLQRNHAGLNFVPGQPVYLYGANCDHVLGPVSQGGLGDLAPGHGCPGGRAINPQAFANVSSGNGNAPRNFASGFGAWQMDLAVRREFPLYERLTLQFRAEAFNVFNHPNFGFINTGFCSSPGCTFGQATGTLASSLGILSPLYQQGGPRSMQFALKFVF